MCNLSQGVLEIGRKEGWTEGRAEGIFAVIDICREVGLPDSETMKRIIEKFSLTEQEARKYLTTRKKTN